MPRGMDEKSGDMQTPRLYKLAEIEILELYPVGKVFYGGKTVRYPGFSRMAVRHPARS